MIFDFLIGMAVGVLVMVRVPRAKLKDAGTQVEGLERASSPPVAVPMKRKSFVPGQLKNFWGADS
jgi:hypothetical protein